VVLNLFIVTNFKILCLSSTAEDYTMLIYTNTIVRATPYLFGMLLAYILVNKITVKMPKWLVLVEWSLNTALCLTLVYVIVIPYSRDFEYKVLGAAFFAAFHRVGWSIGIGWVIWACVNGYAGMESGFKIRECADIEKPYVLWRRACECNSLVEVLFASKQVEFLRLFGSHGSHSLPRGSFENLHQLFSL
jgi:hypothetical protein